MATVDSTSGGSPLVGRAAERATVQALLADAKGGQGGSLVLAGYLFGNIPWVKANLDKIIWGAILIPGMLVFIGAWAIVHSSSKSSGRSSPSLTVNLLNN